ncbi:hypothetical protein EV426DRAFT_81031 [Tirmania nivea]|nr:hypothetical protein EV426DRAFT_81031 [Tirmania nivea]
MEYSSSTHPINNSRAQQGDKNKPSLQPQPQTSPSPSKGCQPDFSQGQSITANRDFFCFFDHKSHTMLLFIFDEASKLFNTTEETSSDYYPCLRRILRLLRRYPIWSFFLSTNSHVQQFNLPNHQDPSARISGTTLTHIPPFFALPPSIEMATRMGDPERAKAELAKSISEFPSLDHLALYDPFSRSIRRARSYSRRWRKTSY